MFSQVQLSFVCFFQVDCVLSDPRGMHGIGKKGLQKVDDTEEADESQAKPVN
jgi:hypothetical protein